MTSDGGTFSLERIAPYYQAFQLPTGLEEQVLFVLGMAWSLAPKR